MQKVSKTMTPLCCCRDEGRLLNKTNLIEYNQQTSGPKIVKMAKLHDKLTDTIELINKRFSIQVKYKFFNKRFIDKF